MTRIFYMVIMPPCFFRFVIVLFRERTGIGQVVLHLLQIVSLPSPGIAFWYDLEAVHGACYVRILYVPC